MALKKVMPLKHCTQRQNYSDEVFNAQKKIEAMKHLTFHYLASLLHRVDSIRVHADITLQLQHKLFQFMTCKQR